MTALDHVWLLAIALAIDAVIGDPGFVWRRVPHPVAIIGGMIAILDRLMNRQRLGNIARRILGVFALLLVVTVAATVGWALEHLFIGWTYGWVGTALVAATLLSARSLYEHAAAVGAAFDRGIEAARNAVSRIVGRDPASLDEARICRAAIESLAENFSDGVVAPAFWFALLGLPGLFAYKAINTADSMIGHLTPRHEAFGWAAARLDDLVNLPASRIAGSLIALAAPRAGGRIDHALSVMRFDARKHRSPNAGWPEASMAAALGIALAGPRHYAGTIVADPLVNEGGRRDADQDDIRRALRVYVGANVILFAIVAVAGVAVVALR